MPKMIIIRGLPGSGKTTEAEKLAREMKDNKVPVAHFEADMFHMRYDDAERRYVYRYNPDMKIVAHRWCERMIADAMEDGRNIIVSNTFSQYWEMIPYLTLARDFGYRVEVITCRGIFPNVHGVPEDVILKMRDRWED